MKKQTATIADFKTGNTLYTSEGYGFTLTSKYSDGIWEARGERGQGETTIFENEARHYTIIK